MNPSALLEFKNISKAFGARQVNAEISFQIQSGTVHALIGENGAGKSTLMKILFGLIPATSGEIYFQGQSLKNHDPSQAKNLGFGMVHQHFQLASEMTALDHVILEAPVRSWIERFRPLDRKQWLERLNQLSNQFQMPVPWEQKIENLSVGIQQRIEILKLLAFDAQVLILDEPTAVLTPQEIEQFLQRILLLKKAGKTILLITHKLKEVMAVADNVTVLRHGRMVSSGPLFNETPQTLASKMIGQVFVPIELSRKEVAKKNLLQVRNLSLKKGPLTLLEKVDFEVQAGEILGIAGIEGNGQSELIQSLLAPQQFGTNLQGQISFESDILNACSNRKIRGRGIGLVAEDRLKQAIVPNFTAKENYQLGRLDFESKWTFKEKMIREEMGKGFGQFAVQPVDFDQTFSNFSGGNQQKIVLARELGARPKLMVVAQPTRGVDVGAIELIHSSLMNARNEGCGILLVSSELEELLRLSDRLLVFYRGKIMGHFERQNFDLLKIGCMMAGNL